jgi:hypothetical protein
MGVLRLNRLPALLKRVEGRRLGRELADVKSCRLPGEDGDGLGTGVRCGPLLIQHEGLRGVLQPPRAPGHGGGRVQAACRPFTAGSRARASLRR